MEAIQYLADLAVSLKLQQNWSAPDTESSAATESSSLKEMTCAAQEPTNEETSTEAEAREDAILAASGEKLTCAAYCQSEKKRMDSKEI